MTPAETEMWIEGYEDREERLDSLLAHYAAILLSPHTKKTPKPKDLKAYQREKVEEDPEKVVDLEEKRHKLRAALQNRKAAPVARKD